MLELLQCLGLRVGAQAAGEIVGLAITAATGIPGLGEVIGALLGEIADQSLPPCG